MLVIQHIWSRWDKLSRGANAPIQRLRLDGLNLVAMGQLVAFQFGGDALFLHEHALAHVVDGDVGVGVADLLDPDHGRAQARPSSLSSSS